MRASACVHMLHTCAGTNKRPLLLSGVSELSALSHTYICLYVHAPGHHHLHVKPMCVFISSMPSSSPGWTGTDFPVKKSNFFMSPAAFAWLYTHAWCLNTSQGCER